MILQTKQNQAGLLAAIHSHDAQDADAERNFDDFTLLASRICDVPIALISVTDGGGQCVESYIGLDISDTPRTLAYCDDAIIDNQVTIVSDVQEDQRFTANALIRTNPAIRFYAGVPLRTPDGMILGTLCAIDTKPRELSNRQIEALEALARQIANQLLLQRTNGELAEVLKRSRKLEGLIPVCSSCRKVRKEDGHWTSLEEYLVDETDIDITHGICPVCLDVLYPDLYGPGHA